MHGILIVEDDSITVDTISIILRVRWPNIEIQSAATIGDALLISSSYDFDLILLDLHLPDSSGTEAVELLRTTYSKPIMVVSAQSDSATLVKVLEAGADDFVTKPIVSGVFLARVNALLRRASVEAGPRVATIGPGATLDFDKRIGDSNFGRFTLTSSQWKMAELFVRNGTTLTSFQQLGRQVWNNPQVPRKTISVAVRRLRDRIHEIDPDCYQMESVPGLGYRLVGAEQPVPEKTGSGKAVPAGRSS